MKSYIAAVGLAACLVAGSAGGEETGGAMYSYSIITDGTGGVPVVELRATSTGSPRESLAARIAPTCGSNLYSLSIGGTELLYAPATPAELRTVRGGTLVLYPTPNRVRNGVISFMGSAYTMQFPGLDTPRLIHGLVWDDAWQWSEPVVTPDGVVLKTWYEFDGDNPRFAAYPFTNTLRVTYTLMADRIRIAYSVQNRDTKALGFGFGLHPFWKVIGGRDITRIQAALPLHMEATPDLLPTGMVEPATTDATNLMTPRPVSELRLDDVYLGATPETPIRIEYDAIGLSVRLVPSADFTHLVVYTPDRDFFCIENQTCSTDAHNLFARGLTTESHLQIVQPGDRASGVVDYIPAWNH